MVRELIINPIGTSKSTLQDKSIPLKLPSNAASQTKAYSTVKQKTKMIGNGTVTMQCSASSVSLAANSWSRTISEKNKRPS
jgi:hypothetical protein